MDYTDRIPDAEVAIFATLEEFERDLEYQAWRDEVLRQDNTEVAVDIPKPRSQFAEFFAQFTFASTLTDPPRCGNGYRLDDGV